MATQSGTASAERGRFSGEERQDWLHWGPTLRSVSGAQYGRLLPGR
jgi:hypothetical protein